MPYFQSALPKIVLGPTLLCFLVFVYGFIVWISSICRSELRIR